MTAWTYNVDVVSPQFPCGAAWLANALIEMGVHLRDLWGYDTEAEWCVEPDGRHRYVATHLPWRQTLASLQVGRNYAFGEQVRPRFSHLFPWQFEPSAKLVYMVRDPRDALYSEWRRHQTNEGLGADVGFEEFVRRPFFGCPASFADMLWLHLHCWAAMRDHLGSRMLVVRFEDWKRDPETALAAIARWMGVPGDASITGRAAAASDVQHLLAIQQQVAAEGTDPRRFNRLGLPEEWRQIWRPEWFDTLGSHWQPLFRAFGYTPPATAGNVGLEVDLAAFLAHRGLVEPELVRQWTARCGLDVCSKPGLLADCQP